MNTKTTVEPIDARLDVLTRKGRGEEADAAIAVYERIKSARAIAESLLPTATAADVLAIASALDLEITAARAAESTRMSDSATS